MTADETEPSETRRPPLNAIICDETACYITCLHGINCLIMKCTAYH